MLGSFHIRGCPDGNFHAYHRIIGQETEMGLSKKILENGRQMICRYSRKTFSFNLNEIIVRLQKDDQKK